MGAKENLDVVERLQAAVRDRDADRYGELLADDAVFRMAGVPAGMGGVVKGKEAILGQFGQQAGGNFEVKQAFADDENVCVIGKVTAERFAGNQFLRGVDRPFATYECLVYRIEDGKVAESTAYVNWLDPYVQVGLVDPASFST